jgi:hypothetical protein
MPSEPLIHKAVLDLSTPMAASRAAHNNRRPTQIAQQNMGVQDCAGHQEAGR